MHAGEVEAWVPFGCLPSIKRGAQYTKNKGLIELGLSYCFVFPDLFDNVFLHSLGSKCEVIIIADDVKNRQLDAEDKCSFAKWACWTSLAPAFCQDARSKDKGPTSLWEKVP